MSARSASSSVLALYSFTLRLSAACMFALQPMAGRMLLPLVGGTPAGWVTAMAFFQVMLLAGYALAHLLSRFTPLVQGVLYLLILGAGTYWLPVDMAAKAGLIGETPDAADVFLLLAATLAVPFIALSATSSTLQRLFMATGHPSAKDPYFLYAASNLGSFAGLLSYPFIVEPNLSLSAQTTGWHTAYLVLLAAAVISLFFARKETVETQDQTASPALTNPERFTWLCLSFLMCSLLMGVTTYITTDLLSIPMVWVIPLAIYLLAFVSGFARKPLVSETTLGKILPFAVAGTLVCFTLKDALTLYMMILQVVFYTVFVGYCGARLANLRPSGRHLSEYYLILSLGGALGGMFNAFAAPALFMRVMEYPLAVMILPLLLPEIGLKTRSGKALASMAALALLLSNILPVTAEKQVFSQLLTLCAIAATLCLFKPRVYIGYMLSILVTGFLVTTLLVTGSKTIFMDRNFFGALKVYDAVLEDNGGGIRLFKHGTTLHGIQLQDKGKETTTTSYFSKEGPLGDVITAFPPQKAIVIGLGAGTINCHTAPGREYTFIDIDPAVVHVAQKYFTFLTDCPAPRIIIGDGRLEMARLSDEKFDLLVIDAFSSDSIPVHLLTREALEMYFTRLNDGGVIAIHISNRHFRLHPPVAATADSLGLVSKYKASLDIDKLPKYAARSLWTIVARNDVDLDAFAKDHEWKDIPRTPGLKPWTDDYTNLLSALKL